MSQPATQTTLTQEQTAHLEGRVLSLDGMPIRKASLILRPNGAQNAAGTSAYAESSDAEGKFVFDSVLPGRYTLSAERNGFVTQVYGARSNASAATVLTLNAGQSMTGLVIQMTPHGVVTGRVVDSDGDPLFGVQVQLLKMAYVRGRRQLQPAASASTDDLGNYRIAGLAPGRYYAAAQDNRARFVGFGPGFAGGVGGFGGPGGGLVRRGRTSAQNSNVPTYYPNALDPSGATPLDVAAGRELRGVDIRVRHERVYSIRGNAIDSASGAPAVGAQLALRPRNSAPVAGGGGIRGFGGASPARSPDGAFEFQNLLPGTYVITTLPGGGAGGRGGRGGAQGVRWTGRAEVTVSDADVEGVSFQVGDGARITGSVRLKDGDLTEAVANNAQSAAAQGSTSSSTGTPVAAINLTVSLTDADEDGFPVPPTRMQDDGTFELRGIAPARYLVNIGGVPQGMYVQSIRFGGQDVTRTPMDLTSATSGELEVLLSKNAAEVSGTVRNANAEAMGGVMVTMWPKTPVPDNPLYGVRSTNTDQNGGFRFANLAPGDYLLAAWEEIEQGLQNNPAFLRSFDARAAEVKLNESSSGTAEPRWITREAAAAELAKLP